MNERNIRAHSHDVMMWIKQEKREERKYNDDYGRCIVNTVMNCDGLCGLTVVFGRLLSVSDHYTRYTVYVWQNPREYCSQVVFALYDFVEAEMLFSHPTRSSTKGWQSSCCLFCLSFCLSDIAITFHRGWFIMISVTPLPFLKHHTQVKVFPWPTLPHMARSIKDK